MPSIKRIAFNNLAFRFEHSTNQLYNFKLVSFASFFPPLLAYVFKRLKFTLLLNFFNENYANGRFTAKRSAINSTF